MATKASEAKSSESKRTTEKASDHFEPVAKVVKDAGPEGITLAQLSDLTGIRARVLHNVLYRLEKAEKVRRIQEAKGRKVLYASTEVKAPRAARSRKSTPAAKKSTTTKKATTKAA
jgi:hypothetical protein